MNQHPIGSLLQQYGFDLSQHGTRHLAMISRSNTQIIAGWKDLQLVEKDLAHLIIIMLAGVHKDFVNLRAVVIEIVLLNGPTYRRSLDELWASSDNAN